jgi:hypothetical protein
MANATIIASAIAFLVVVASVIAIALNLSSAAASTQGSILDIPSAYTAHFNIVWRNGVGDNMPSGWSTLGVVSVYPDAAAPSLTSRMDFQVTNRKEAAGAEGGGLAHTTTYTGGRLYGDKTCIDPATSGFVLPDLVQGRDSLEVHATPIGPPDTDPFWACGGAGSGQLYSLRAFGAEHVLCVVNKQLRWAAGVSYKLTVSAFIARETAVDPPEGADMTACLNATATGSVRRLAAFGKAGDDAWFHASSREAHQRRLVANRDKHVCFLHGMGADANSAGGFSGPFRQNAVQDAPVNANMVGTGAPYWGDLAAQLGLPPSQIHAIAVDSTSRGWNNLVDYSISPQLQDVYYDYVKYYKCDVVFAHSMGNTILAALAGRGKGVRWYELQGPLRGSTSARMAADICSTAAFNSAAYAARLLGVTDACKAASLGYCAGTVVFGVPPTGCVGRASIRSLAALPSTCKGTGCLFVDGSTMALSAPDDAKFAPFILGRLCGNSAYGSGGFEGVGLAAIAALGGYATASDGMVEMATCVPAAGSAGFTESPTSTLYVGGMNHADGTGRYGDSAMGTRQPITWIHNMITRGSGSCPIAGSCAKPGASVNTGVDAQTSTFCATSDACADMMGQSGMLWTWTHAYASCVSNKCTADAVHDAKGNCLCGNSGGYCSGSRCVCPFSHGTFCDRCWDVLPTCTGGWAWYGCKGWTFLDHAC